MKATFCLLLFLLAEVVHPLAADTIELGGPRKVECECVENGHEWRVQVAFRSVSCFSREDNYRLNTVYAQRYALTALARLLKARSITASAISVTNAVEGNRFAALVIVSGTSTADAVDASVKSASAAITPIEMTGSLLNRASEWRQLLETMLEGMTSQLYAHGKALEDGDEKDYDAFKAFAERELKLLANLKQFVGKDLALLSQERRELQAGISLEEEAFTEISGERLKASPFWLPEDARNALPHWKCEKDSIPMRQYLLDNLEKLRLSGMLFSQLTPEQCLVLILGSGRLDTGQPSELAFAEAKTKADAKARSQLVAMRGTNIKAKEAVTQTVKTVSKNGEVMASSEDVDVRSAIEALARGYALLPPQIASWTSQKGDVLYIAYGTIIELSEDKK